MKNSSLVLLRLCTAFGLLLLLLLALLAGCSNGDSNQNTQARQSEAPPRETQPQAPPPTALAPTAVPDFNADTAFFYVVQQVAFGPRVPGTPEHRKCGDWLVRKLEQAGLRVTEQTTQVTNHLNQPTPVRNIIASLHPQAQDRILLSAHWDTRPRAEMDPNQPDTPIPGANDGASGVAVLLELARHLASIPPTLGVDLILWDAEDGGDSDYGDNSYCLGSQYWARNKHTPGYHAQQAFNLDMVGAEGATFLLEGYSRQFAPGPQQQLWQTAHQAGFGSYFYFQEGPSILDDHYYMNELGGIPTVNIIHLDNLQGQRTFFEHWHTQQDDVEHISRHTLKAVGQTLLIYLHQQAAMIS